MLGGTPNWDLEVCFFLLSLSGVLSFPFTEMESPSLVSKGTVDKSYRGGGGFGGRGFPNRGSRNRLPSLPQLPHILLARPAGMQAARFDRLVSD